MRQMNLLDLLIRQPINDSVVSVRTGKSAMCKCQKYVLYIC